MWDRCYGLCNTQFLSHVLRNFIEDGVSAVSVRLSGPFLSHVLRNFIEDELVDGKAGTAHNS